MSVTTPENDTPAKISGFKSRVYSFISLLILCTTLWVITKFIGWKSVFSAFSQLSIQHALILVGILLSSYFLRAWRTQYAMSQAADSRLPYGKIFHLQISHNVLNNLLPMRSGEVAFPVLMKLQFNTSYITSTLYLMLFRVLDLFCLLLITLPLVLWPVHQGLSVALGGAMIVGLLLASPIKQLILRLMTEVKRPVLTKLRDVLEHLPTHGKPFFAICSLSIGVWVTKLTAFIGFVVVTSDVDIYIAASGILGADLSTIFPIHGILGTGTFEGAFVLGASYSPVTTEQLLTSAVQLHVFHLTMTFATYFLSWLIANVGKGKKA